MTPRAGEVLVDASGADGGVGDVDDRVPGRVEVGDRAAGGQRLADPDLAGDQPDGLLVDEVADSGGGFEVGRDGRAPGRGQITYPPTNSKPPSCTPCSTPTHTLICSTKP
ncbi:MAG: hypothetical protein ACRDTT_15550 [Pseudonocardiaceae bacterium]